MKRQSLLFILFSLFSQVIWAQPDWQQINTVDEICTAYPEKMKALFQNFNLNYPGLEATKNAYTNNDIPEACKLLLAYYNKYNNPKELPPGTQKSKASADSILQDIYTFQMVTDQVPHLADGHLDWSYAGPEDDIEWAWALNRHYPVFELLDAYSETGNPKYAQYIDRFTKDWIISSWPYPGIKSSTAMWRGLEVSFRVKVWSRIFFDFTDTDLISPATRLLILCSLPQHAHYARNFHARGNWLTMEISGLATVASSWPELKESPSWMNYSIETMVASMKEQVYPDGVQNELTSHYHYVALSNFNLFAEICRKTNVPLPEYYTKTLEAMWNYIACTMRPDGFGLLNNDSDRDFNRENILKAASSLNRSDWTFIASNGNSGTKPEISPSFIFPWAGQLISRSDFGADAQWSFFDIGPWGSGHQHNDKLHLSVAAFGRDLLVDGGRFAYRGEVADKFRKYAIGSESHNVILVDGKGQAAGPKLAETPVAESLYSINKDFDYASGTFDKFKGLEGECTHTRTLFYQRGNFWIIVDQIATDRPRKIEILWHWHPECKIQVDGERVSTDNEKGNLQIIPAGNQKWKLSLIKGKEEPGIQGWYSEAYNKFNPNSTTIYSTQIKSNSRFIWILFPSEKITSGVKTEIISESPKELKLKIYNSQNDEWYASIPY